MNELNQYSNKALIEVLAYRLNADMVPRSRFEEVMADRDALEEREANCDRQSAVSNEVAREMDLVKHLACQYGWEESPLTLHAWIGEKLEKLEEIGGTPNMQFLLEDARRQRDDAESELVEFKRALKSFAEKIGN